MKKSKITAEQIEQSLAKFCEEFSKTMVHLDVVPPGWFTAIQIAEQSGKSYVTTTERIRRMIKQGRVERKNFTIQLEQRVRPVPHYKLKK
jgi:hypothetical protein